MQNEDHPHAYGDKKIARLSDGVLKGSSPRVWGQASIIFLVTFLGGIIPTRMGTSSKKRSSKIKDRDHPHAYGDKKYYYFVRIRTRGSSPRVWGQGSYPLVLLSIHRDHPHAYGDKNLATSERICGLGSSPRVWGQVLYQIHNINHNRIIPTRMGTRTRNGSCNTHTWDHPHAYGDKLEFPFCPICKTGSSPRVWGQVYIPMRAMATTGIIPTRMGTS